MAPSGGINLPGTPLTQGWNLLASGDFNGDHITDLLWKNASSGATAEWVVGAYGRGRQRREHAGSPGMNLLATGDFNGDHITDLFWQQASTGARRMADVPQRRRSLIGTPLVQGWNVLATGDLNGDGHDRLDVAARPHRRHRQWLMAPGGGVWCLRINADDLPG